MKPDCPTFDRSWRAACQVVAVERGDVDGMIRRHYIGKWPGVCVLILAMKRADRRAALACIRALKVPAP